MEDDLGDCYIPDWGDIVWDPRGDLVYFHIRNSLTTDDKVGFARARFSNGEWGLPKMVLLDDTGKLFSSSSVSPSGLLSFYYETSSGIPGDRRIGLIDPDICVQSVCKPIDGRLGVERPGWYPRWTKGETILFRVNGTKNLREYIDPLNAVEGPLDLGETHDYDSGL